MTHHKRFTEEFKPKVVHLLEKGDQPPREIALNYSV